ncbi:MAG: hypothetical protein ABW321_22705, partial [Polyangiales bacterium]
AWTPLESPCRNWSGLEDNGRLTRALAVNDEGAVAVGCGFSFPLGVWTTGPKWIEVEAPSELSGIFLLPNLIVGADGRVIQATRTGVDDSLVVLRTTLGAATSTGTMLAKSAIAIDIARMGDQTIVVWQETDPSNDAGTTSRVMAATIGADGQCVQQLSQCAHQLSGVGVDARAPRVAADGVRHWAAAVWEQAFDEIAASVHRDNFWSFPQPIVGQAYASTPDVVLDGQGRAHVLFHTSAAGLASSSVIATATRTERDEDWTVTPSLGIYGHHSAPQLAVEEGGTAFAAWSQSATDENVALGDVYVARYTTTTHQWQLDAEPRERDSRMPSIAVDASGRAIAVWVHGGALTVDRYE